MPYATFEALYNDFGGPARRLQILATDRYARDFDIPEPVVQDCALLLAHAIDEFTEQLAHEAPLPLSALGIVDMAHYIWGLLETAEVKKFPFSKALRVAEDVYQRTRLACMSSTAADFNRTVVDACGTPATVVTDISRYSRFYELPLADVATINRWLVTTKRQLASDPMKVLDVPKPIQRMRPRTRCVKREEAQSRRMELHEDLFQRWRNTVYKPDNMVAMPTHEVDKNTLLAVHHRRLTGQHVEKFVSGTAVDIRGKPAPGKSAMFFAAVD